MVAQTPSIYLVPLGHALMQAWSVKNLASGGQVSKHKELKKNDPGEHLLTHRPSLTNVPVGQESTHLPASETLGD